MEDIEGYSKKVKTYSDNELEDILQHIDRERFKDRYEAVLEELKKRKGESYSYIVHKNDDVENAAYFQKPTGALSEIKSTFGKYGLLWKGFLSKDKYGGLGRRIISTLIDSFIIIFIFSFLTYFIITKVLGYILVYNLVLWAILILVKISYGFYFIGKFNATPGQKVVDLEVVTEEEIPLGYKKSFFRALVYEIYTVPIIGQLVMFISVCMILLGDRRQAIHDKICKTVVINIKE